MTPPLPLAELVQMWEERSRKCYADGEYTAEYHLDRCIDELAALPLGRCETCREWQPEWFLIESAPKDSPDGFAPQIIGWHRAWGGNSYVVHWLKGPERWSTTMQPTHWTHMPAPPAAGEET